MNITRRAAIRNLLIVTAGVALLPSCLQDHTSIKLNSLDINSDHEKILASLTDAIIPKTDTPGALDLSAHLFVLKMVDDCYTKEEQQVFMTGFEEFNRKVKDKYQKSFADLTGSQKEEFLSELEGAKNVNESLKSFYASAKRLTVLGYTTSKYYLADVKKFSLIPGKYEGSVPVSSLKASV
jgi:hypothetical protein